MPTGSRPLLLPFLAPAPRPDLVPPFTLPFRIGQRSSENRRTQAPSPDIVPSLNRAPLHVSHGHDPTPRRLLPASRRYRCLAGSDGHFVRPTRWLNSTKSAGGWAIDR